MGKRIAVPSARYRLAAPGVSMVAFVLGVGLLGCTVRAAPPKTATGPKDATEATKAANARVLRESPFADKKDFEFAHRGFMARPKSLIIKDAKGNVVWDMESYQFIQEGNPAPDSVNPSLWRNAQLNTWAANGVTTHC
jgi:alkyl sulfatase BDS1-like metallo-beta-lactamase superfamily hydrolase